jgi:4'-phosphopantetheinyl transferase superfamily
MPTSNLALPVGNDVVDLALPAARGKSADERFLARIATSAEREFVRASPTPDATLWTLWAAKEAAYKALARRRARLPFSPRAFEVTILPHELAVPLEGRVATPAGAVCVRWDVSREMIHCVGWREVRGRTAPRLWTSVETVASDDLDGLPPRATARELASVHSPPSLAVRVLARRMVEEILAQRAGCDVHIEVVRPSRRGGSFGPPRVLIDGKAANEWSVSLSHDGRFVACAVSEVC